MAPSQIPFFSHKMSVHLVLAPLKDGTEHETVEQPSGVAGAESASSTRKVLVTSLKCFSYKLNVRNSGDFSKDLPAQSQRFLAKVAISSIPSVKTYAPCSAQHGGMGFVRCFLDHLTSLVFFFFLTSERIFPKVFNLSEPAISVTWVGENPKHHQRGDWNRAVGGDNRAPDCKLQIQLLRAMDRTNKNQRSQQQLIQSY